MEISMLKGANLNVQTLFDAVDAECLAAVIKKLKECDDLHSVVVNIIKAAPTNIEAAALLFKSLLKVFMIRPEWYYIRDLLAQMNIRELIEIYVNEIDYSKLTIREWSGLLEWAAQNNDVPIAKIILKKHKKNFYGDRSDLMRSSLTKAFHIAIEKEYTEVLDVLCRYWGVFAEDRMMLLNAFTCVVEKGSMPMVMSFLKHNIVNKPARVEAAQLAYQRGHCVLAREICTQSDISIEQLQQVIIREAQKLLALNGLLSSLHLQEAKVENPDPCVSAMCETTKRDIDEAGQCLLIQFGNRHDAMDVSEEGGAKLQERKSTELKSW